MLFRKKRGSGLFNEVEDYRQLVYDFRRRTNLLFENYRAVRYKKPEDYDLEQLKIENQKILEKLIAANAIDAGNEDCLLNKILAPIRDALLYLENQALEHMDFYNRQGDNMTSHIEDLENVLNQWREKEVILTNEHDETKRLWHRYNSYELKGGKKNEG